MRACCSPSRTGMRGATELAAPARRRTRATPSGRWMCCAISSTRSRSGCSRRISPDCSPSSVSPIICRRWPTSSSTPRSPPLLDRRSAGRATRRRRVRDHRLRQAGRQGARLRSDLDLVFLVRRPGRARHRALRAARAALITWLTTHHGGGTAVRHRPAAAARRRRRPAGVLARVVRALPARAGLDVGAPGADARALRRRRRCDRRGVRGRARRDPASAARPRRARAPTSSTMRRKMVAGHPNPTALFDLKHDAGGMVDVEFAVQYLVLAHAHAHRRSRATPATSRCLRIAGDAGLDRRAALALRRRRLPRIPAAAAPDPPDRRAARARRRRHRRPRGATAVERAVAASVRRAVGMVDARRSLQRSGKIVVSHAGRRRHVDGRPRRLDLVRRQDGAVARRDHPRPHPHAALRHGRVRGRARVQDGRRTGDLPAARPHRPPVPLGAHLRR